MKLPNFLEDSEFNELRFRMGAAQLGEFSIEGKIPRLSEKELNELGREGIDVTGDRIEFDRDGTLKFKGIRVLVYIRDIPEYAAGKGEDHRPKFHFAACQTLVEMKQKNRFQRYVVATRDDGVFHVNFIVGAGGVIRSKMERSNVCQNCLNRLSYRGFSYTLSRQIRLEHVKKFTLKEFFAAYPKDQILDPPSQTSDTQPVNDYTDDWALVSETYKVRVGKTCERCGLSPVEARFLHVHHLNHSKYDNRFENLQCLCVGCHAEEHPHMKGRVLYKDFVGAHPSWRSPS